MDTQPGAREFLCCAPKTWALVIGIIQTFGSVLVLIYESAGLAALNDANSESPGMSKHLSIVLQILVIIVWLFQLLSGCFLVWGSRQDNLRKVTVWFGFTLLFVPLTIGTAVWRICAGGVALFIFDISLIPIVLFCLWVVNIYRHQLESYRGVVGGLFQN